MYRAVVLCLSGDTPEASPDLGSWSSLRVHGADGRRTRASSRGQGDKVGPKASGRVADATVATAATPVGETRVKGRRSGAQDEVAPGMAWARFAAQSLGLHHTVMLVPAGRDAL